MKQCELVIFDCDGTLVDSLAAIARAANLGLADVGHTEAIPHSQVAQVVGLSLHEAVSVLLPGASEETITQGVQRYKFHYKQMVESGELTPPLFPGVRETLEAIHQADLPMAIATGKSRKGLLRSLSDHDLGHYFQVLTTADDAPSKPHPRMVELVLEQTGIDASKTLIVGDTDYDILMGREAGIATCAVTYGCHDRQQLARSKPDYWVERLDQLLPLLGLE
ncbi:MAG: HAD-IA family hydrolase [Magnetococcales bacterium]|nr:HAD-IA family hydrolase [Magnetococcales bacterium]